MRTYKISYEDGIAMEIQADNMLELLQKHKESGWEIKGIEKIQDVTQYETVRFKLDINLDDELECNSFIQAYGTQRGKRLANLLGFTGEHSSKAANALSSYAWNKYVAIGLRKAGSINGAKIYEDICDRIYRNDIKPLIECW